MLLHIKNNNPAFQEEAVHQSTFNIKLMFQPPNSPDLNVLDLGLFNAIQSLQHQSGARMIKELFTAMEDAFQQLHHSKLNNIFLTLKNCMEQVILHIQDHSYVKAEIGKKRTVTNKYQM